MLKRNLIMLFVLLWIGSACSAKPPKPSKSNPSEMEWTVVHMEQSGGIMGLSRSVKILVNGKYQVRDERAQAKFDGELSQEEISKLNDLISAAREIPAPPKDMVCADCFVYVIEIQGKGKPARVELNDVTLSDSGFEELTAFLQRLIESKLE